MIASGKPEQLGTRNAELGTADPFAWVGRAPFFQAGLAGYSDAAMRLVARRQGCPFAITEAMLDMFLINGGKGLKDAELTGEDHPIAGQLMGSHPKEIAAAAKILVKLGYDVVDINLACPVKKIKKRSRGGHLLSAPQEATAILQAVRQEATEVPLTVKLRRAYDDSPEMEKHFYTIFEKAIDLGYAGATVHARTVEQKYLGPSRWPFLAELTSRYRPEMDRGFHLFGSGDIFSPRSIFDMLRQTGVQAVSVARGCIGNPWVFRQAHQIMRGELPGSPTIGEQRAVLQEHFDLSMGLHGEKTAGRMMRKFGIRFSVHHPLAAAVKSRFIAVKNAGDWKAALEEFYPADAAAIEDLKRKHAGVWGVVPSEGDDESCDEDGGL